MGGRLVRGNWESKKDWEQGRDGAFERQKSSFRQTKLEPETGRYILYVSYACPWASRVLAVRSLMKLQDSIPLAVVHPLMDDNGWAFRPGEDSLCTADPVQGAKFLHELYTKANAEFTGRVTVPILWDKKVGSIVNNESSDIIRMLARQFAGLSSSPRQLYPEDRASEIDKQIDFMYDPVNNGVYRCGFAGSQSAYERAFKELFEALDQLDKHLATQPFLVGDEISLADICLFTTLIRFDAVYYVHFKCNGRRIVDCPGLSTYLARLYMLLELRETVSFEHIKQHYYRSHPQLNPKGIVPLGPEDLGLST